MAIDIPTYELELRLDGSLLGDVRSLAQGLKWAKRRTLKGVDSIEFTLNDKLFASWLEDRGYTITDALRPLALDCRVIRDGVAVVGGFLATMPAYSPNDASASLAMKFDGYLNLLDGVYIYPTEVQTMALSEMLVDYITMADTRAETAGKAFGFVQGDIDTLASVSQTFDDYKSIKEFISDRSDNTSGAGIFDVYFHPDRVYDIKADANFGTVHDYTIYYPASIYGVSAMSISADEESGFGSKVIAVGAGQTSSDADENTAVTSEKEDTDAAVEYGYREVLYQNSSVSLQSTLDTKAGTKLAEVSNILWEPKLTLSGRQVDPAPEADGGRFIWVGDTVSLENNEDLTGMTSGDFRVQELEVSVSGSGAETITPTLERIEE